MSKKEDQKRKIALVLSGGGARGIAHIGVIEELPLPIFAVAVDMTNNEEVLQLLSWTL